QPAGPGPHRGHAGPRGRPARPRRSHPARRAPGRDRLRAGLGAAAAAPPRGHRAGAGHRRAPHGPGAAATGGRDDRGGSAGPRAGAAAATGAEGELMSAPVTDAAATPAGAATPAARAGSAATRTVAVTVPDWPLLAALDRHQRRREAASGADAPPTLDLDVDPVLLHDQHRVTHAGAAALAAHE